MKTNYTHIKNADHQTSAWTGGTTTQLLIYPHDADYAKRDFKWRISSAKVEVEESLFTHLPGISRILMVIDGELLLQHEGKYSTKLHPFEQDAFMGDWTTKSFGKVTDFNLMMAKGCVGRLEAISLKAGEDFAISLGDGTDESELRTDAFYMAVGQAECTIDDKTLTLEAGDLISLTRSSDEERCDIKFFNGTKKEAKVIRAVVFYSKQ